MSAAHRSLARLPLEIFTNLNTEPSLPPSETRQLITTKLHQSEITTIGDLFKLSPLSLLRVLNPHITHDQILIFLRRTYETCAAPRATALSLLRSSPHPYLSTGVPVLDEALRGGFRFGTISELVGRAGVGKTQLAMQLCVVAARYGFGSIYVDTERKLSLRRMKEIAAERAAAVGNAYNDNGDDFIYDQSSRPAVPPTAATTTTPRTNADSTLPYKPPAEVLSNVTIHSPRSTSALLSVLSNLESEILLDNPSSSRLPIRLLILDSIAAPARMDFGSESGPERVAALFRMAQILKRLADSCRLAIVVINQVWLGGSEDNRKGGGDDFVAVTAALGSSWCHCVSTRLLLEHKRDPHREGNRVDEAMEGIVGERGRVRTATVVKSNVAGRGGIEFEVTNVGVSEIGLQNQ